MGGLGRPLHCMADHRGCPHHQQLSHAFVASPADATEALLAARRALPRHQPAPGDSVKGESRFGRVYCYACNFGRGRLHSLAVTANFGT